MGVYLDVVKETYEPGEDFEEYMCCINSRMKDLAELLATHVYGAETAFRMMYPECCDNQRYMPPRECPKQTHETCSVTRVNSMDTELPHIPTKYPETLKWFMANPKGTIPADDHRFFWVHGYFTPEQCRDMYALLQEFPLDWEYDGIVEGFRIAVEGGFWIITG